MQSEANAIDQLDRSEYGPDEGRRLINMLRVQVFENDAGKLALALGRPVEEIQAWANGSQPVDEDGLIKARALGEERGLADE